MKNLQERDRYPISIDVPRKGDPYHWKRDQQWVVKGGNMESIYSRSAPWGDQSARVLVNRKYFDNDEAALFEIARQLREANHRQRVSRDQRSKRSRPGKRQREAVGTT